VATAAAAIEASREELIRRALHRGHLAWLEKRTRAAEYQSDPTETAYLALAKACKGYCEACREFWRAVNSDTGFRQ